MADTAGEMDEYVESLRALVRDEMDALRVPGVALGLLHDGRERTAALGVTSIENPLPVDAATFFQIGSITKTVTATALMRLVEQGVLHLDAPVRAYLPGLRLADQSAAQHVTLRHLLNHTAGWLGDYFDDTGAGEDALALMVARMADLPQLTPLGAVWSYNNAAFYLAGRILEVATGDPYEVAVRALVLAPLGMRHAYFFPGEVMTERFAVGHETRADHVVVARPWALPRAINPAGGLITTVPDLLRYARFWLGDGVASDGTRLLSAETMRLMRSPLVPAASKPTHVGISWLLTRIGSLQVVYHAGGTKGQTALLSLIPERNFALVALTNAGMGGELNEHVIRAAVRLWFGVEEPPLERQRRARADLLPYVGHYSGQVSHIELRLGAGDDEGVLVAHETPTRGFPTPRDLPEPMPPARLAFYADDRVIGLDAPIREARSEFVRDEHGAITWLRFGGRVYRRNQR